MSDKIDMLFIRACKLGNYEQRFKRLNSIHRRFYLMQCNQEARTWALISILTRIMEEKNIQMRLTDIIASLNPDDWFGRVDARPYYERVLCMIVGEIALTEVSKIDGYIRPCRWNNTNWLTV